MTEYGLSSMAFSVCTRTGGCGATGEGMGCYALAASFAGTGPSGLNEQIEEIVLAEEGASQARIEEGFGSSGGLGRERSGDVACLRACDDVLAL